MKLSAERIREFCNQDVFDRATSYRDEGRIKQLDRYGGVVTATVQGSQPDPYTVDVWFEFLDDFGDVDTGIYGTCTCPYDWEGYCKHIVAVLLELLEQDIDLETKETTIDRLFNTADAEDLHAFLRTEVENDPALSRRFLACFAENSHFSYSSERPERDQP
jgi:uncharacterized Zn finger protein